MVTCRRSRPRTSTVFKEIEISSRDAAAARHFRCQSVVTRDELWSETLVKDFKIVVPQKHREAIGKAGLPMSARQTKTSVARPARGIEKAVLENTIKQCGKTDGPAAVFKKIPP